MPKTRNQISGLGMVVAAALLAVGFAGCGNDYLVPAKPPFKVVDGTPAVDQGKPTVQDKQPSVNPGDFANNAPVQVDVFYQKTVRKVDILWVVDNSCSMVTEQSALASNFQTFIGNLTSASPPVDYHLGITTVDATSEGGALRPLKTDPSKRYIACNANGSTTCNVADPVAAFTQTVQVGTGGSAIEKGLLAAHLALTDPMKSTTNAGFLRSDAALYVIIISDEGDSSCSPLVDLPAGTTDRTSCHMSPYCHCGDTTQGYGATDYYVRFFDGLKGYGNSDLTALAAIVAVDQNPFTDSLGDTYLGCTSADGSRSAFYAPRYIDVATRTGGITTSICDSDYTAALDKLGFAVSGQRRDFPLTRRPVDPTQTPIQVYIQTDPTNPSTRKLVPESTTDGWTYVLCVNGTFTNVIRFSGSWVPPPQARIDVTYQVNAGAGKTCN